MDLFEEEERKRKLDKNKEQYKKTTKKILNLMTILFGGFGFAFLSAGIVFIFTFNTRDLIFLPFVIVGGVFLIVCLILNIVFRSLNFDKLYDRYIDRANSGKMIYSTHEMSVRIIMLENRVKELEDEIASLKKNR